MEDIKRHLSNFHRHLQYEAKQGKHTVFLSDLLADNPETFGFLQWLLSNNERELFVAKKCNVKFSHSKGELKMLIKSDSKCDLYSEERRWIKQLFLSYSNRSNSYPAISTRSLGSSKRSDGSMRNSPDGRSSSFRQSTSKKSLSTTDYSCGQDSKSINSSLSDDIDDYKLPPKVYKDYLGEADMNIYGMRRNLDFLGTPSAMGMPPPMPLYTPHGSFYQQQQQYPQPPYFPGQQVPQQAPQDSTNEDIPSIPKPNKEKEQKEKVLYESRNNGLG